MSRSLAAIIGGAAGSLALLVVLILFLWRRFLKCSALRNKNSDTGSSDPSTFVGSNGGIQISLAGCGPLCGQKGARQFTLEELAQATKNFSESNLVGEGSFGSVYKGLLLDGTVVAIKRRQGVPRQEFIEEENGLQMLVYEYLPNGSISSHVYDNGQNSITKLEFKRRLSVAIGAAKGLSYLHSLTPPLLHNGFKTSNVLVDENFIAKVADAGILNLLQKINGVTLSHALAINIFQDPAVGEPRAVSETSDVYSFGVFLLELITGRDTARQTFQASSQTLAQWVESHLGANDFIDHRLATNFTSKGMKEFIKLTLRCLNSSGRERPKMETVAEELDRILETEMTLTTVMGDATAVVTLGSQLFSA